MLILSVDVTGVNEMQHAIDRFTDGVTDLSDIWPDVRDEFFNIEREQFDSEGAQGDSGNWAPLSPAYAAWKAVHYGTMPILQRTGALIESLTSEGGDTQVDIQPMSMTIGTNVLYAIFHQQGTGRMPARPIIDMTPGSMTRMSRIIRDWCVQQAREALEGMADVAGGA